jgi:galactose mutarotase-like enzyme
MFILENECLKVSVANAGAELSSVIDKESGLERVHDANPEVWNRHAPILFPFVGKVVGGVYRIGNQEYEMKTQHGFARDMEFKLLKQIDNYIAFVLNSDEKTYINYPFHFSLILSYELKENEIVVGWNVINKDNKQMYFSIGGHPAFNVPLLDENRSDCYLYFKNCQKIINTKISKQGYSMNETIEYQLENGYLPIKDDLFDNDALVIENQNINEVSILDKNKNAFITVKMDCPLFGIWSPSRTAPFVCIEPWYGCCDVEGFTGNLEDKKYQNKLNVNEEFKAQYSICVF